ncbi:MAG TPA: helix-turn-helix transcriptional regulator [Alphaproteobacteria bacterium]|nr:helix-turn-helix transcriptional regulator [Alphaproteobacteria bacterium]
MPELMTTKEVAEYLRIKERKVYDLVRTGEIPCSRVTGKWLFPTALIDLWVARSTELPDGLPASAAAGAAPAPVVAGSHDPLLEWALRESGSELALHPGGSLDGLRRLAAGEAVVAGSHAPDADGGYRGRVAAHALASQPVVVLAWAWRRQGLVVAQGNPHGLETIADLARRGVRVVLRQEAAGSQLLLLHLLAKAELDPGALTAIEGPARSETDVARAVVEARADAGLAIEAAARAHGLDFVPLHRERYDLAVMRRDYFEAPVQALLSFARSEAFKARARELGGYEIGELGQVIYNAP